ncbi:MarR family winged helix-turn-helix transcriptional regulator [Aneurinibacillus sp. Ricciae_BoGa-3]|uniref:MarR family winged helix-turn-helix transcriptional regulator n=1 Tax=Aneurinibacillus sp. Ricciae_BoGa-3 TaxID=3022697 RepID=UPI00233F8013|nr:MarR family winged helix-turn-helix transcriptional regulator [Aneurinibacillus sp. Ricciae_BoGa-3]WCK53123.1 MarR family winged helix-turn-helix transcriptional regulator [Aneurinibacillus sp. Ricciae_BoGa-3]
MRKNNDQPHELHDVLNTLRAIAVVNKDDWETAARNLQLDSAVQLNILWIVYCYEGVRVTQIAEWTFWHPSSVVIHVKKMMEKGLVTIEKSDKDGRVVNVYLTDKGRTIIEESREQAPEVFRITRALESLEEKYGRNVSALFFECLDFLAEELHGQEKINWIRETGSKTRRLTHS